MNRANYRYLLILCGVLFFNFGFVTWLNGTLIQFLKITCELNTTQAFFVASAFYISYFVLAIPSSAILKRTGFKNGMTLGLVVLAAGCLIFIPAAMMRSFPLFLFAQFVQGMGLALQQTAVNPFVSTIGPIESGAQRISIMGIANKGAGILSPVILGSVLLHDANSIEEKLNNIYAPLMKQAGLTDLQVALQKITLVDPQLIAQKAELLNQLSNRLIVPYLVLAVAQALLAWFIRRSALPNVNMAEETPEPGTHPNLATGRTSVWQFPHLVLGALAIFFYVGAEVMAGDGIGLYGQSLQFGVDQTKYFTSFTLAAMLVGYVLSIALIPKYVSQQNFLKYSALLGLLLTVATYFTTGSVAVGCIAALGLANAVMWPAIFPLAINSLGRFTQIGSALLIMGIAGGAILPPLYGWLAEPSRLGYQLAFVVVMLPCYLYVLYYAVWGYKPR